jgi:hypothetical protein
VDSFFHDAMLLHAPELTLDDSARYGLKTSSATVIHAIVRGEQAVAALTAQDKQRISAEDLQKISTREIYFF